MIILYLILGHLIADFVLQPAKLVQWKIKSKVGLIVHCAIHVIVSAVFLFPYLNLKVSLILFGLGVVHFVIDYAKINTSLKSDKFVGYFVIDQIVHFVTLLGAGVAILYLDKPQTQSQFMPGIYNNPYIILFLILLVFMSYTIEIYRHTRSARRISEGAEFNYHDMLLRILALTFVYILFTGIGYLISKL